MKKIILMFIVLLALVQLVAATDVSEVRDAIAASAGGASTQKINMLIAIDDQSSAETIQLATSVVRELDQEGYILPVNNVRLFSEVNAYNLQQYDVVLAIKNYDARIIEYNGVTETEYTHIIEGILEDGNANFYRFPMNLIATDYLGDLFNSHCISSAGGYCSDSRTACVEYSIYGYNGQKCVVIDSNFECNVCSNGCRQGECVENNLEVDFYLREGWNLLPLSPGIEYSDDAEDIFEDHIVAAYVYDPREEQYYDIFSDDGDEVLEEMMERAGFVSVWVYSDVDEQFTITYDVEETREALEESERQFKAGWNFYVVLPQMIEGAGYGYVDVFGKSNGDSVVRDNTIYAWDHDEWEAGNLYDVLDDEEVIGVPYIAYYEISYDFDIDDNNQYDVPDFPDVY